MVLTLGSLFSGIGGLDLGLERAGFEVVWQVEIDDYAQKVLAKHWPNVTRFRDVRDCGRHNLAGVEIIAGGFPCTNISWAGRRAGFRGGQSESGLWFEFGRIISELRPGYAVIENVPAALYPVRHNERLEPAPITAILTNLAECGYDAEWQVLSAAAVGAPQKRERLFIVAYPNCERVQTVKVFDRAAFDTFCNTDRTWQWHWRSSTDVSARVRPVPDSRICGMATGVPYGLDRFRGIGNAVVPQVAQLVGNLINLHAERTSYISRSLGLTKPD